jgi:hypothetical protein
MISSGAASCSSHTELLLPCVWKLREPGDFFLPGGTSEWDEEMRETSFTPKDIRVGGNRVRDKASQLLQKQRVP